MQNLSYDSNTRHELICSSDTILIYPGRVRLSCAICDIR